MKKKFTTKEYFSSSFLEIVENQSQIFFFDECSFELNRNKIKTWEKSGIKSFVRSKKYPVCVRLLMISSLTAVECFQMTNYSSDGETIFAFIKDFL